MKLAVIIESFGQFGNFLKKQALTECDAFLTARQVLIYCLKLALLICLVRKYCTTDGFNAPSTLQVLIY